MRNWIAGAMTMLGTLLVLSGAAITVLRAWLKPATAADTATATATAGASSAGTGQPGPAGTLARGARGLVRLGAPDRLIAWGIVLLVLAAIAAGAIGFNLTADAGAK